MSEIRELSTAMGEHADTAILANPEIAHLVASGRRILSMRAIDGLTVDAKETRHGISATVAVKEGTRLANPVHLCFGVLHAAGTQKIRMEVTVGKNASAHFIAHCYFPRAERVRHLMDASVSVRENAEMRYEEIHFHGPHGGITVVPKLRVDVRDGGRYFTDFALLSGRVGSLDIDYDVEAGPEAIAELTARVFGHADDTIRIREKVVLAGTGSRSLIKARVAIEDEATAEITGITEGNAAGARGHVDCMEIVKDHAVARAVPIVNVTHPLAKVTHEAAIGSVDKRQMETLMAHGLSPEEAVDIIVRGILR